MTVRRLCAIAFAAAATACGGSDLSMNCSMNLVVNNGAPQTVQCFAAGAMAPSTGNAVSIAMTGTLPGIDAAQFAMTLPAPPTTQTYGAAQVTDAAGQIQLTGSSGYYAQSKTPAIGSFSVVLTSVNAVSANGQTAYFIHGTATVTLQGQSAPGTATLTATF